MSIKTNYSHLARIILLIFLCSFQSFAQDSQEFTSTQLATGSILPVTASETEIATAIDLDVYSYINLRVKENTAPYTAYKFSITLKVSPLLPDGTPDTDYNIDLAVENNMTTGIGHVIDLKQHVLNSKYIASIEVVSNTYEDVQNGQGEVTDATVPDNVVMTVGYHKTRYYELPETAPTIGAPVVTANNELQINWTGISPEAQYYDVEWTWVDNYGDDINTPLDASIINFSKKDFERNSTRVQTKGTSYNIPLVYSRGYIIYRVRAVGNFLGDVNGPSLDLLSKNKYGPWTAGTGSETTIASWGSNAFAIKVNNGDANDYDHEHESNKNWQFQASYAEDGKKKEVVSYFDGSLRNRQTVTTINTDDNAVVGEVIYDAQGRPAVEVLPVPTSDNVLKYHNGTNQGAFNLNETGTPYNYLNFDLNTQNEVDTPSDDKKMGTTLGASNYYSPSNTFSGVQRDRIPNALQYPFSQIEYTPDNTGRIRRKSGVGVAHQLGSGHEMEYYYGVPEQIELNRLFGYAVGNAVHYKKNMVLDPNRQLSISYIDPQGRTIATALAGSAPPNLDGLKDEIDAENELHDTLTVDLFNKVASTDKDTNVDNNEIGLSGTFGALQDQLTYNAIKTVVFDDTREFVYDATITPFNYGCVVNQTNHNQAYDLIYDLTIDVLDEDANSLLATAITDTITLDGTNTVTYSNGNGNLLPINVKRGTFTVSKTLKVNQQAVEDAADAFLLRLQDENDDCYIGSETISPAPIIIDGCFSTCEECIESIETTYPNGATDYVTEQLGTYETGELTPEEITELTNELTAQYNAAIVACNAPCNDAIPTNQTPSGSTSCLTGLEQLLNDMSPIGQYGNGSPDNPETLLSIFNTENVLYSARIGQTTTYNSWKNPNHSDYDPVDSGNALYTQGHYYNEDGTISYIKVKKIITPAEEEGGEDIITYEPAIDDTGINNLTPTEDVDISNEYWVEPQYLMDSDHMTHPGVWQDNWAHSLLQYHPEYEYLLYTNAVCELEYQSYGSDGFDSYLKSIETYADADTAGFLGTKLSILDDDPYFKGGALSLDPSSPDLYAARESIMNEALNTDFDDSGHPMINSTYGTLICNSLTICDINATFSAIKTTVGNLPVEEQDQFWNSYKASYLALKQRIQSVFINAYAQNQGRYNGCIGLSEAPVALVNNIATYSAASTLRTYLNGITPSDGLCSDAYVDNYIAKQKRFLPTDMFHNAGADGEDVIADIAEQVNYQNYVETGICPLARDLEVYLDGYLRESLEGSNTVSDVGRNYNGQYIAPALFEEFGGIYPASTVTTTGSVSGQELTLTVASTPAVPNSDVTVVLPAAYQWSGHGSTWSVLSVSGIYATYNATNEEFEYSALVKIDVSGTTKEIIISGTTDARISNCSVSDPTGVGQFLGSGNTFDETGACNRESYFSKAVLRLLNGLVADNQVTASNLDITNHADYAKGYLPDFFEGGNTVIWKALGSNTYAIDIDGEQRFLMTLNDPIPTDAEITNISFEYQYNNDMTNVIGQNVKLTWLTNTFIKGNTEGTVVETQTTLLNFSCCGDFNDYYVSIPTLPDCSSVLQADGSFESFSSCFQDACTVITNCGIVPGVLNPTTWTRMNGINNTGYIMLSNAYYAQNGCINIEPTTTTSSCADSPIYNNVHSCQVQPIGASNGGQYFFTGLASYSHGNQVHTKTGVKTQLTGLVIGKTYTVSFDQSSIQTKAGRTCAGNSTISTIYFGDQTREALEVSCVFGDDPNDKSDNNIWQHYSTTFVANATDIEFGIEGRIGNPTTCGGIGDILNDAYFALDNIKVFADEDGDEIGDDCDDLVVYKFKPSFSLRKQVTNNAAGDPNDTVPSGRFYFKDVYFSPKGFSAGLNELVNFEFDINFNDYTNDVSGYNDIEITINNRVFSLPKNTLNMTVQEGLSYGGRLDPINILSWNGFYPMPYDLFNFSYNINNTERIYSLNEGSGTITSTHGTGYINVNASSWITDPDYGTGLRFNNSLQATWSNDFIPFIFEDGASINFKASLKFTGDVPYEDPVYGTFGQIAQIDYQDPQHPENLYQLLVYAERGEESIDVLNCNNTTECIAQPIEPVSCTDKFLTFTSTIARIGDTDQDADDISEEEFCDLNYAYITDAYDDYLIALGVNDTNSIHYITIGTFGATEFGYGYNDMQTVINAYAAHVSTHDTAGTSDDIKTWAQFTSDYLYYDLTSQGATCISLPASILTAPSTDKYTYPEPTKTPCEEFTESIQISYSRENYEAFLKKEREDFINAYLKHATEEVVENFSMSYFDKEYQYTLYYYDQAGNLHQTVPPEGVDRFTKGELDATNAQGLSLNDQINTYRNSNAANEDEDLLPDHRLKTQYEYNSLNQLVWQQTPDGGETRFAYDALGRIIASQNAKQLTNNTFSYTTYDDLGRIIEAGELVPNVAIAINDITGKLVYTASGDEVEFTIETTNPDSSVTITRYPDQLTVEKREVTKTKYTEPDSSAATIFNTVANGSDVSVMANARNRVTAVYYYPTKTLSTAEIDYENALYYNYDIHGNVIELAQHNRLLADSGSEPFSGLKRVEYEYDLISGNVNQVYYQKGEMDQFIHKYAYDADNRIVNVQTSSDGFIWETDAAYEYFAHGPLARTLIGDKEVQGMDYAYTLQGWLKGVNSNIMDSTKDLGTDGAAGSNVAQDAMGYALTYYGDDTNNTTDENDYASIGSINAFVAANNSAPANIKNLYNGNIKQMTTDMADLNETALGAQINNYTYDQLNRIKKMEGFNASGVANYSGDYTYDRNGNLETLKRNAINGSGVVTPMDDFTYEYNLDAEDEKTNNKLRSVQEVSDALDGNFDTDIDSGYALDNYMYDEIGQLISDTAEGITNIDWRVDGKVASITKNSGAQTIKFTYDGLGNRIAKTVLPDNTTTVYSRDAQGNVLAVYETNESDISNISANKDVILKEHHIYGSSRLGIEQKNLQGSFNQTILNGTLTTNKLVQAQQDITVAGDPSVYTVETIGNLILKAGNSVIMKPGFTAKAGSTMLATIEAYSATPEAPGIYARNVGDKRFELSNHLGNVLSVVSDRKLVADPLNFSNFTADVLTYNDYYPFGALLPNRHGSSDSYRYGFAGMEKDDELKGEGNSYDFGSRTAYDPRIARFSSVDPRMRQYPHMSPYVFAANNPIYYEDQDGEGPIPFRFKKYLKKDSYYVTGFLAGIGDGLIETLDMAVGAVQASAAWTPWNPYAYTEEAAKLRAEHRELGNMVIQLFRDEDLRDKMYANIKKELGDWFDQTTFQGTMAEAGYQHGKLIFDGILALVGVSEVKYLMKTGNFSANALKLIAKKSKNVVSRFGRLKPKETITNLLKEMPSGTILKKFKGKTGVYVHYFDDGSIYIGKASDLSTRPRRSLKELLDSDLKGTAFGKKPTKTELFEFDPSLYDNIDHMENDFLNSLGGKKADLEGGGKVLNQRNTSNYKDHENKPSVINN